MKIENLYFLSHPKFPNQEDRPSSINKIWSVGCHWCGFLLFIKEEPFQSLNSLEVTCHNKLTCKNAKSR